MHRLRNERVRQIHNLSVHQAEEAKDSSVTPYVQMWSLMSVKNWMMASEKDIRSTLKKKHEEENSHVQFCYLCAADLYHIATGGTILAQLGESNHLALLPSQSRRVCRRASRVPNDFLPIDVRQFESAILGHATHGKEKKQR